MMGTYNGNSVNHMRVSVRVIFIAVRMVPGDA